MVDWMENKWNSDLNQTMPVHNTWIDDNVDRAWKYTIHWDENCHTTLYSFIGIL